MNNFNMLPVAVLGAGPVGLAAAARLIERRIPFFVLEAANQVGANLTDYGHVRLFSPWQYNIDPAMARLLEPTGWQAPPADDLPIAAEVVNKVLEPFARLPQVAGALWLGTKVVSVSREGFDKVKSAGREDVPFVIRALHNGNTTELKARAVIDATGTWNTPNPVGASGLPAIGEQEVAEHIYYGIPDILGDHRSRYAGKRTLVVGAGHSAANALLFLAELATEVPETSLIWSVRSSQLSREFGGGDADALPARGELGTSLRHLRDRGGLELRAGFRITEIRPINDRLDVIGLDEFGKEQRIAGVEEIICATGQRPNLTLTSELRVNVDPVLESSAALGPLIDPNLHSCGTVRPHGHRELSHPEKGLYTVGVKSYGRAPTFLMATGFEQVRSVVAAIAGDFEAADRVELNLPETGVCSTGGSASGDPLGDACCSSGPVTEHATETAGARSVTGCCATGTQALEPISVAESGCCVRAANTATESTCCPSPTAPAIAKSSCCG